MVMRPRTVEIRPLLPNSLIAAVTPAHLTPSMMERESCRQVLDTRGARDASHPLMTDDATLSVPSLSIARRDDDRSEPGFNEVDGSDLVVCAFELLPKLEIYQHWLQQRQITGRQACQNGVGGARVLPPVLNRRYSWGRFDCGTVTQNSKGKKVATYALLLSHPD